MKLVKHIANLGYGSRKEVQWMFREGRITDADGEVLYADDQVPHEAIRVDGEPLDPPAELPLAVYPVVVEDGRVLIEVPDGPLEVSES